MKTTILNNTHREVGGKMVEFAGFDMPIQYKEGIIAEHQWVRGGNVGLFDVSHMCQAILTGKGIDDFWAKVTPSYFKTTTDGKCKYTVLTNEKGGIIDDLIITKLSEQEYFVVFNAACAEKDLAWVRKHLPSDIKISVLNNRALIAVQGKAAVKILNQVINENVDEIGYMSMKRSKLKNGVEIFVSRTGYTGEDGFEVSIANDKAVDFWKNLLGFAEAKPIGLGARDSLRLEMGYPLYGNDLDDTTSPIEADMTWIISKFNTDFIGSQRILHEKQNGVARKRVGVKLLEKGGVIRHDNVIKSLDGIVIGKVTSGGYSPILKESIGQGYVASEYTKAGSEVFVVIRDKNVRAEICNFVFVDAGVKK